MNSATDLDCAHKSGFTSTCVRTTLPLSFLKPYAISAFHALRSILNLLFSRSAFYNFPLLITLNVWYIKFRFSHFELFALCFTFYALRFSLCVSHFTLCAFRFVSRFSRTALFAMSFISVCLTFTPSH